MNFTQYMAPSGRRESVSIEVSGPVEAKATELNEAGWSFECEVLSFGNRPVYLDCCDEEEEIANAVVPNGPGIREAVEKVVCTAHERWSANGRPKGKAKPVIEESASDYLYCSSEDY